jgi:hypothetical protein
LSTVCDAYFLLKLSDVINFLKIETGVGSTEKNEILTIND